MKNYKYYSVITGLFSAILVISNILDTKIFMFAGLDLPAGIILFPLAYLIGDILTEVYGYAASRKVIWTGFASLILLISFLELGRILPAASFWSYQESFNNILGHVPRIVIASISAYFIGEFCNSFVLAKLKVKTEGKGMPIRFVASTLVGQAVDTTVFVSIAFIGVLPFNSLFPIILSAWAFKVGWEIIALPMTLPIVKWLKKVENEDYFDKETDFNPFQIK
ncbi:queuosine precursor transporter [Flavobacterium sp. UBA6031]|uniref:queuosine precursor transporter n=1 Tax=Flavobacterium sp. UBA6031 TaxID=1946551 RepID=UPI0025C2ED9E|nr:queuosine precursor transporter [Flavobacterium sp. UBA6031]